MPNMPDREIISGKVNLKVSEWTKEEQVRAYDLIEEHSKVFCL